jgi:DNA-binding transcriptional ArsR family regulator
LAGGKLIALENRSRAGAHALPLAADPVNRKILQKASERPLGLPSGDFEVSSSGQEALFLAAAIERWLGAAPQGRIEYGGPAAEQAIDTLVGAWSAAIVHALARGPMSIDDLDGAIEGLGRSRIERHLMAMRSTRLVEVLGDGDAALYSINGWLRLGIAPLIVSARLERNRPTEEMTPVDGSDVEAGFRMALGLIELPEELTGVCRLRLNLDEGRDDYMSGVTAHVEMGRIVAVEPNIEEPADAWAHGTLEDWLDTVINLDARAVATGGDAWLTAALVRAIHRRLFGPGGR